LQYFVLSVIYNVIVSSLESALSADSICIDTGIGNE